MIFNINFLFLIKKKHMKGFLKKKKKGAGDFQSPREQHGPIISALVPLALPHAGTSMNKTCIFFYGHNKLG